MVVVMVPTSHHIMHFRLFVKPLDDRKRKRVVQVPGFPEYSLNPFDFV